MLRKILHKPQAILGLAMMLAVILAMALAPQFASNDPNKVDILHKFTEPCESTRWVRMILAAVSNQG